jgi:hypothetical protein
MNTLTIQFVGLALVTFTLPATLDVMMPSVIGDGRFPAHTAYIAFPPSSLVDADPQIDIRDFPRLVDNENYVYFVLMGDDIRIEGAEKDQAINDPDPEKTELPRLKHYCHPAHNIRSEYATDERGKKLAAHIVLNTGAARSGKVDPNAEDTPRNTSVRFANDRNLVLKATFAGVHVF